MVGYSKGKKASIELKNKLKEARGNRIIINNGEENKFIFNEELEEYCSQGWKLGRLSFKLKCHMNYINNGVINKRVRDEELEEYCSQGWELGHLPLKNMSNDELNIFIDLLKNKKIKEIANYYNVSEKTIRNWKNKYNLTQIQ